MMKPKLIDPRHSKLIEGMAIPGDFYWVAGAPAPLAGMRLPKPWATPWEALDMAGFRWVVCLCSTLPVYDPTPLGRLATVELTDLVETHLPHDPDLEEKAIGVIAKKVIEKLNQGEGVIVHCAGGRGRTGTVLGVVLRKLGVTAREAVSFLDSVHRARGKDGWPEAPWQREVVERTKSTEEEEI